MYYFFNCDSGKCIFKTVKSNSYYVRVWYFYQNTGEKTAFAIFSLFNSKAFVLSTSNVLVDSLNIYLRVFLSKWQSINPANIIV